MAFLGKDHHANLQHRLVRRRRGLMGGSEASGVGTTASGGVAVTTSSTCKGLAEFRQTGFFTLMAERLEQAASCL